MDEIQQLIDIKDRKSAFEYLSSLNKRVKRQMAARLIYRGVKDNKYIADIILCRQEEIEELRTSLTFDEAMDELGVSEKSLKNYIRRGLTVQDGRIPLYAIEIMKDPAYCIIMQIEYQKERLRTQTKEEYIQNLEEQIIEFEEEYGGDFQTLFGHLTYEEIDFIDNSTDVMIWKELIEDLWELKRRKDN
ncbi:MAG: hypothetical protein KID09_21195 [Paenibacillus macerans]|uniref:hypothetical protein n=1 Tax=Paenibacillus macerans TaxID=44252 RepID=UPI00242A8C38|nr:hypothetical protein [Paenibacillus macerans]MBS5913105.1 hypothetical protein [Paenibacillus macerans]